MALKNYSIALLIASIKAGTILLRCGYCKNTELKLHARYCKYYYLLQIIILRVRCSECGKTHSLIPSFSFPGRSIGMDDMDEFLLKVNQGMSVYQAGKEVFPLWQQTNYIYKVVKTLGGYVLKAKAIFPTAGDHNLSGFAWIQSVVGKQERVLYHFNLYCLENKVNCLFGTHTRFLWLGNRRTGAVFSHTNKTNNFTPPVLNSS